MIEAVAEGDLSQHMALEIEGRPLRGEFRRIGRTVNTMVDQLSSFADEVTRVAREVGTDGRLGGQADVRGVAGTWRALTDSVNTMASNLTNQVRSISTAATAIAQGDLSAHDHGERPRRGRRSSPTRSTRSPPRCACSPTRSPAWPARWAPTGLLGGQAVVPNVAGTWKNLTDAVNLMAANLTAQVRGIAQVATAVASGDLSQKIAVDARGEILELKSTVNTMVDQLARSPTRSPAWRARSAPRASSAARPRSEGRRHVAGPDRQRQRAGLQPHPQVRNIAQVTTAVAQGDLSQKITVDARARSSSSSRR